MKHIDPSQRPLLPANPSENENIQYDSLLSAQDSCQQISHNEAIPEGTAYRSGTLTRTSAYIIVISRIIGTGIFATPGLIAKSVGSIGLSLSVWLVGATIAATNLAVWLEYGRMLPRSGRHKVYIEFTYRYPRFHASTLVAVQAVLLTFTTGNYVMFGHYLMFALDIEATDIKRKLFANILGWMKILLVFFIACTGIYVMAFSQGARSHSVSWKPWTFLGLPMA
ncbi:hypothetical protein AJ78_07688 [Emergomyces pasteurianus Ep9510]|uniref:Uncharacterized protein n=1 Tax=Emergomyces pasteurianus Ep9510 TaxID=1447872 RepID=A0A1J9Q8Q1_9EURO|nr:hypothetical protein AJ78_07688 [Emergomyces pasteurianus Ep9510]